jgi:CheY-like chemotaxis protein
VVDDTSFNIMAVKCMIFENFQLGVDEAVNGKIALEMYKEGFEKKCGCQDRTYKLIIMDL